MIVDFFTGGDEEETDPAMETESTAEPTSPAESTGFADPTATLSTFKRNDNGNNGNNGNGGNGNHYGWESGEGEDGEDPDDDSTGEDGTDGKDHGSGNTNNTDGSENQSGILFPEKGEVSELEEELIGMIKTEGHEKNYELIEYVNDVNRENAEVLMELNINGKMDTAYSYGNERLTVERFDGWTGYYTYDPRGSVSGVTGSDGYLWQSYRYDPFGDISFGKPQYNNVYAYNAESFNPNLDTIYLRARYYNTSTASFLSEDTYLGDISDPLTLNRYNYALSSYLNYKDPSGHDVMSPEDIMTPDDHNLSSFFYNDVKENTNGDWKEWSRQFTALNEDQQDYLADSMSQAEDNSQYDYCHEEVQLSEKIYGSVYSYFIGMLVGYIEGFQPPVIFSSDEGLTIDEFFSMKVPNSTAYSIGRLIGNFNAGLIGAVIAAVGGTITGGSIAATIASSGTASGVTILTAGKGIALAAGGTVVMANASEGMQEALSDLLDGNTDNSEKNDGEEDSEAKSIDDILDGAEETTNNAGIARNFEKTGGYEKTLEDFNALQPSNVKDIQTQYGPGKVGYLEDGTTVVARPGSKTGGATLEIKISNKKIYKIRY